jgi:predicted alpha/beta-hydrolase family hydrolase
MIITPHQLSISSSIGDVSAETIVPDKTEYIVTLAHGAGAGMEHSFMVNLAKSLANLNIATLRFNFPFIQQKKRRPDVPAVAHKTIEAAIGLAEKLLPGVPLFVSGKSFGGRMSSQYLSMNNANRNITGIIFYGFPLHPAGKPSVERAEHLKKLSLPMLFLQGTRDELATLSLIESVCSSLPNAKLITIDGADHAFKAGKKDVISILSTESQKWMEAQK